MLIEKLKNGFKKSFWIANLMELFERLAYYGQMAILAVYLTTGLNFSIKQTGSITAIFGGLIYFLPIFAGALADKFRFKKSFSIAFSILTIGYLLMASTGIGIFRSFYANFNLYYVIISILVFTAMGGSFIKPSVLGTVSLTTTVKTKSVGYAIYYWLVNIGGALGPFIAYFVRTSIGMPAVYLVSATSCFLMFLSSIFIFKEPEVEGTVENKKIIQILREMLDVFKNAKFMIFLLIFSLFWIMFWQIYVIIPLYISDYISKNAPFEIIISLGAWGIILFQLPVNFLTKRLKPVTAIVLGFAIATSAWFIMMIKPDLVVNIFNKQIPILIAVGLVIFSIGEMTQAPRYYEYIADIAPKGQIALFQGYAFLPIAIGWLVGGNLGAFLYETYAKNGAGHSTTIFLVLGTIGVFLVILMSLYNFIIKKMKNN